MKGKHDISRAQLRSKKESRSPLQAQLDRLLNYYQTGQYGDAGKLAASRTQEFPKHQFPCIRDALYDSIRIRKRAHCFSV